MILTSRMSFLEYKTIIRGYNYYDGTRPIYYFELYWGNVNPFELSNGNTKFKKQERK